VTAKCDELIGVSPIRFRDLGEAGKSPLRSIVGVLSASGGLSVARLCQRPALASRAAVMVIAGLLATCCAAAAAVSLTGAPPGRSTRVHATTKAPVGHAAVAPTTRCPWLKQSLPIQTRVNMLLAKMSLTDKIAEMYVVAAKADVLQVGPEGVVPAQPALCIPKLVEQDGSLGVYGSTGATQLPSEVSLGSAWDPKLAYQYGVVDGKEHRTKGTSMVLGPGINIQRDPRWGRNFEMFSEDPLLTSALGTADIEGIQSQHVMADAKHLVTYNQETYSNPPSYDTIVTERALHEIYLPPFYSAVVHAQVASIMCAYTLLNGVYSCQDPSLITGLLDARWGFDGFIRTDSNANASTADSANAGLDQERGSFWWDNGQLAAAVADGAVRTSTINAAVRRILTQMFRFELFNDPPTGTLSSPASTPADRAVALKAAESGTVLLKNTGQALPLHISSTKSIAVIGPAGSTRPITSGGGSSHVTVSSVISPLTGIQARVGPRTKVTSYSGTDPARAAAVAAKAQVSIVFGSYFEREAFDQGSIALPGQQNAMITAVAAANPHTIVVLNTGGPVLMPWLSRVKGVVEAWYPGQEDGTAIASVLFGDVDPAGHLPQTFPISLSKTPTASRAQFPGVGRRIDYSEGLDVGYRWYDAKNVTPLFPFGFGLSYTSFRFSRLTVTPGSVVNGSSGPETVKGQAAKVVKVTAVITNTGGVRGSDVAQLYIGDPAAAGEPPRQLEGFARVTLRPHQSQTVTFRVTGHELSYFNPTAGGWTLPSGQYSIYVGDSSALSSLPLRGALKVTKSVGNRYAQLAVPATPNPGTTFMARARFVNDGDLPIADGTVRLGVPSGWKAVPVGSSAMLSLAAGQSATRAFRVTVPEKAEGTSESLTAELSSAGPDGAGDLSDSSTVSVPDPVSASASSLAVVTAGGSARVDVVVTSHMQKPVVVDLRPSLPAGVRIKLGPSKITVPGNGTATLRLTVSVASGTTSRSDSVALDPGFTYRQTRYPMAATALTVEVPYRSLQAAYDNRAISDDRDVKAADFDGSGISYSDRALSAAGLGQGTKFTVGATSLVWPDVPAGTPDNVSLDGQTILMPATSKATQLTFVGASGGIQTSAGDEAGIGVIQYTDGTDQAYMLTLDNWFRDARSPDKTVTTVPYVNETTGSGSRGGPGKRTQTAHVFATSIALEPGKRVASVTLPSVATLPGDFPMHVFALALGRASK
jgi:beta-glucosidase